MTDELVESILQPGLQPGAVDVFLEFICYSGGPLPEELIPQVKVKALHFYFLSSLYQLQVLIVTNVLTPMQCHHYYTVSCFGGMG